MGTHTYPGRGLSLSQLVFALSEEVKRAAYSPSYVVTREVWRSDGVPRFITRLPGSFTHVANGLHKAHWEIPFESVPWGRVFVLPNVEALTLIVGDGGPSYEIAAHISCPSAGHASSMHEQEASSATTREILPNLFSWNAIARRYTSGLVEEVALEIKITHDTFISCSLAFQSPDATVLRFGFEIIAIDEDDPVILIPFEEIRYKIFAQASRTIREHPLLANVKRIHISHRLFGVGSSQFTRITNEAGRLFKSVGPLEELTLNCSDLYLFLTPFVDNPESYNAQRPVMFPPIEELVIPHPLQLRDNGMRMKVIVELAKLYHVFERVIVCAENVSMRLAKRLGPWVGVTDC